MANSLRETSARLCWSETKEQTSARGVEKKALKAEQRTNKKRSKRFSVKVGKKSNK